MKTAVLLSAVVGVAALVAVTAKPPSEAGPAVSPVAAAPPSPGPDSVSGPEDGASLSGQVRETMDVAQYTYVRLATAAGEVWAAVSKAPVSVGSQVTIADATRMEHFESPTLKRTFDVIYFGNLAGQGSGSDARAGAAPPLAPGAEDDALPPGHPAIGDAAGEPSHAEPATPPAAAPIASVDVPPATGKNAKTIAALYAEASKLEGRQLRIRGQVVKATLDVQGKNYFHLRDSSGEAAEPRELVVASSARAERGDVVLFEGTLRADVDVGIGVKYPVFLADAKLVQP